MAKVYQIPSVGEELEERIAKAGFKLERNSKNCIKLVKAEVDCGAQYLRYYSFHLESESKDVSLNLNEYTSSYKRAVIWIDKDIMRLVLDIQEVLEKLLRNDEISDI